MSKHVADSKELDNLRNEVLAFTQAIFLEDQNKINETVQRLNQSTWYISQKTSEQDLKIKQITKELTELLERKEFDTTTFLSFGKKIKVIEENLKNQIANVNKLTDYLPLEQISNFIGREDIFIQIDNVFTDKQYVAITAFAGTGKSSCALEYAYREKNAKEEGHKKTVRWFNANSADKVDAEYRQMAQELKIDITQTTEILIRMVNSKIVNDIKSPLLFIFDDVEAYVHVSSYLLNLPDNIKVIITSRSNILMGMGNASSIELPPFNEGEVKKYLENSLGTSRVSNNDIETLVEALRTKTEKEVLVIPYKLSKAVAYLKEDSYATIKGYLKKIKTYVGQQIDQPETEMLVKLLTKSPIAWKILQYAVRLDPDFISIEIFREVLSNKQLASYIKELAALSLVTIILPNEQNTGGIKLHRLVQEKVLSYLERHPDPYLTSKLIITNLALSLDKLFPKIWNKQDNNWFTAQSILTSVIKFLEDNEKTVIPSASLYSRTAAVYELILCNNQKALAYREKALEIHQTETASAFRDVARSLSIERKYQESIVNSEKALQIYCSLYDKDYGLDKKESNVIASIIKDLNISDDKKVLVREIAHTLSSLGHYNHELNRKDIINIREVINGYHLKALKIREKLVQSDTNKDERDSDKHATTYSYNHLGNCYYFLGDYKEAIKYHEEALKVRKELYPKNDHTDIAESMVNLGMVYVQLGAPENISKGIELQEQALVIRETLYKEQPHSHLVQSWNHLGQSYIKQAKKSCNNYEIDLINKSLGCFEEALKMSQQLYQNIHFEIAESMNNLGIAYNIKTKAQRQIGVELNIVNQNEEIALFYFEKALPMLEKLYKDDNSQILVLHYKIGIIYKNLEKIPEAEKSYKDGLEIAKKSYPQENFYTKKLLKNLQLLKLESEWIYPFVCLLEHALLLGEESDYYFYT